MRTQNSDWPQQPLDEARHNLNDGAQVKTNEYGEGWLKISNCQDIYIFQDSGLVASPNPKSDRKSGNDTSLPVGSAAWNNQCDNVVIHTDSAQIELKGTWVLVAYLPNRQLTLLMVLEGRAELQPVLDANARTLGEGINVQSGNFLFSTPGNSSGSVADLTAREPHPFDQLQPLLRELNLWAWMAKTREKARKDSIPFPEFLIAQCQVKGNPKPRLHELPGAEATVLVDGLDDGSSFEGMVQDESGWIFGISSKVIGNSSNAIGWVFSDYLNCPSQLPTAMSLPRGIGLKEQSSVLPPSPPPSPTNTTPAQDTTPPTVSLSISPEKPTTEDQVTLTSEAQDNESGIDRIEILIEGSLVQTCQEARCVATVGPYSIDSESKERTVDCQVQAYDRAGNPTSQSGSFVVSPKTPPVDTTPPTITINVSPSEPTAYKPITLTVSAEDPESGVVKTGIYVGVERGRQKECEGSTCRIEVGPYYEIGENGLDVPYQATALNGANISSAPQEGTFHVSPPPPPPPSSPPVSPGKDQQGNFNNG